MGSCRSKPTRVRAHVALDTLQLPINTEPNPQIPRRNNLRNHPDPPVTVRTCRSYLKGKCRYGVKCKFSHEPVKAAEIALFERLEQKEANRTTTTQTISACEVTFGAGASVSRVVTGLESSHVYVKNLPLSATKAQVETLFSQPGFTGFDVSSLCPSDNGLQEAIVVFGDVQTAELAVAGLDGGEFGDELLKMEIIPRTIRGSMSREPQEKTITITWPAPLIEVLVIFGSLGVSEARVKALKELKIIDFCGYKLRVSVEMKAPSQPVYVTISGIPAADATHIPIEKLTRFTSTIPPLVKSTSYDLQGFLDQLRDYFGSREGLLTFEPLLSTSKNGNLSATVRFEKWEQAKRAHELLNEEARGTFAGNRFVSFLSPEYLYWKTLPIEQYNAQHSALVELSKSVDPSSGIRIIRRNGHRESTVRLEVCGSDRKLVGAMKVRVERLTEGEKLGCWDKFFASLPGEEFLQSVYDSTHAFVRVDKRARSLRVFGGLAAVKEARALVKERVKELASLEFSMPLRPASVRFFIRHGVEVLEDLVGEENVSLDSTSPCTITIRGGEEARHTLQTLVEQSLRFYNTSQMPESEEVCPVCFSIADAPCRLACGHSYCNACLRHFFASAIDTKNFPLVCMGNKDTCRQAFPIATLQKFLLPGQFKALLEASFTRYLDHHPDEFRHCKTPDCPQIYRIEEGKDVNCPSCLVTACAACGEHHPGFNCEEWRLHRDPKARKHERLLQSWAKKNGAKKCPNCAVLIEKNGGCNHVECTKCKANICWVCTTQFPSRDEVYPHMRDEHGGIGV